MSVKQSTFSKRTPLVCLVETAILIAVAYVLSYIRIIKLPYGSSVTLVSMLPVMLAGIRNGKFYGFVGAFAYAGLQMLQGLYPTPANTALSFAVMILLDYVLAFGVLGVASLFPKTKRGVIASIPVCIGLRFLCHFFSGVIVWGSAVEGMPAALYSLAYNGLPMLVEAAICLVVATLLLQSRALFYGLDGIPAAASGRDGKTD